MLFKRTKSSIKLAMCLPNDLFTPKQALYLEELYFFDMYYSDECFEAKNWNPLNIFVVKETLYIGDPSIVQSFIGVVCNLLEDFDMKLNQS